MTRKDGSQGSEGRWRGRPVAGLVVRALVLAIPVAAGVGVAVLVARTLPAPEPGVAMIGWWALVLGSSTLSAWVADRGARRLLPLAALLQLSLVFPDRAPSRYAVARAAGNTRVLERRVRQAREEGLHDDPNQAAEMVLTLVAALGAHDRRTRGHSERVRAFVDMLADELALQPQVRVRLRWAALLHDIGKLQVEAEVLNKPSRLEEDEWEMIRAHPDAGARLAAPLLPWLGEWGWAILDHHERFDGAGYPSGRSGDTISMAGRIVALADSFETMTAARSYKKPMSVTAARRELARCAGTQFDPALVRAFLNISLGRLMWTIGPMTWLAQIPLVGRIPWIRGEGAAAASSPVLAKTLAGIVALGMAGAVAPQANRAADPPRSGAEVEVAREVGSPWTPAASTAQAGADEAGSRGKDREGRRGGDDQARNGGAPEPPAPSKGGGSSPTPGGSDPGAGGDGGGGGDGGLVSAVTEAVEDPVGTVEGVVDSVTDELTGVVDDLSESPPQLPGL